MLLGPTLPAGPFYYTLLIVDKDNGDAVLAIQSGWINTSSDVVTVTYPVP